MQCMPFCNPLLACQPTCLLIIVILLEYSPLPPCFSVNPDVPYFLHWDAPFALHALAVGVGCQPPYMKELRGLLAGEVSNKDAARYHLLPIASSVNKMNWAGQALLQQLFTWPFQASLRCWAHSQSSHLISLEAVCLWFSPALQMASRPGQDLGR